MSPKIKFCKSYNFSTQDLRYILYVFAVHTGTGTRYCTINLYIKLVPLIHLVRIPDEVCLIRRNRSENKQYYYPTSLCRVQITPKTSTNITRYLYSRGPVRQVFSQRASDEFDSSYEKKYCLSIGITFLRFFLTEILK